MDIKQVSKSFIKNTDANILAWDGKQYVGFIHQNNPEVTWCYTPTCFDAECALWTTATKAIRRVMKKAFIPSYCMNCYKVVVRPQNIDDLIAIHKWQMKSGMNCKSGIETRSSVPHLFGAYHYNRSLEQGLECCSIVKEAMKEINPDITVILKRGCTEFEQEHGDSLYWKAEDNQLELEDYVSSKLRIEVQSKSQSKSTQRAIRDRWKRFKKTYFTTPVNYRQYQ